MRYIPGGDDIVLWWLRNELPTATGLYAVCTGADDGGLSLLAQDIASLLERGGSVFVVVPDASAAAVVASALPTAPKQATIVVSAKTPAVNAVALTYSDAGHQAYLGGTAWTAAALADGQPGVLLDQRRDRTAAARVLADIQAVADATDILQVGPMLQDLLQPCMDELERRSTASSGNVPLRPRGVPTGIVDLDNLTDGICPGDLWVVTGRTGAGKTVLALGFARSGAVEHREPVCVVTAHEDALYVTRMVLSAEARVPLHHMEVGTLSDDDWARLARRMGEVEAAPLRVVEAHSTGVACPTAALQLAAVRTAAVNPELHLLVVDGAQTPWTPVQLRDLKEMAVAHNIGVLVVMPDASDRAAAEAAASRIADLVLRIDRDHDMDEQRTVSARAGEADLIVLRHRRGPVTVITVAFQGHYGRFVDLRD